MGLRYTTRNRDLPGSPDLANRSKKWTIFVHGCYWHRHRNCGRASTPKRNRTFWEAKFERNRARDRAAIRELRQRGYTTLIIWECEVDEATLLVRRLEGLHRSTHERLAGTGH